MRDVDVAAPHKVARFLQSGQARVKKALGALEVIAKPFDPMTLADRIERIEQIWAAQG